jgi:hypothetical protein
MTCLRMTLVIDTSGQVKVNGSGGEVNDRGGRLGGEGSATPSRKCSHSADMIRLKTTVEELCLPIHGQTGPGSAGV